MLQYKRHRLPGKNVFRTLIAANSRLLREEQIQEHQHVVKQGHTGGMDRSRSHGLWHGCCTSDLLNGLLYGKGHAINRSPESRRAGLQRQGVRCLSPFIGGSRQEGGHSRGVACRGCHRRVGPGPNGREREAGGGHCLWHSPDCARCVLTTNLCTFNLTPRLTCNTVLPQGASIICFSTVPPSYLVTVQERLDALGTGIGVSHGRVEGCTILKSDECRSVTLLSPAARLELRRERSRS